MSENYRGKFEKKKQKPVSQNEKSGKGSKPLLIVLSVILGLILVIILAAVIIYSYSMSKINQYEVPKVNYTSATEPEDTVSWQETEENIETTGVTEVQTEPTEPYVPSREDYINFLIVGQDYRTGEENHLADSMIVCTVNTHEKTLTLTSVLRDTQLQVSGTYTDTKGGHHTYGKVKVNMIYASGYSYAYGTADAMGWMNQALYDNFGLEIDHNFEVDFDAFVKAIDILGGIEIDLSEEEATYMRNDDKVFQQGLTAGVNRLEGYSALSYVRMRHAQGDQGDISRTERQRKVITAVLEQVKEMDISTVKKLIDEILPCISTSMSSTEITAMIAKLLPMLTDLTVTSSGTCPMEGSYGNAEVDIFNNGTKHQVLTFNPWQVKQYMRALTLGEEAGE